MNIRDLETGICTRVGTRVMNIFATRNYLFASDGWLETHEYS